MNYNNYIVPACLANPDNSYDNDEAVVTGWGNLKKLIKT